MAKIEKKEKRLVLPKQPGHIDFSILLVVTILCAFGLVMVFSASYYYAAHQKSFDYDGYHFLKSQLVFLSLGYPLMLILTRVNFRLIDKFSLLAYLISFAALVLVLLVGDERNGGQRWLNVAGVSVQPSEIAKFGLMFFMCSYMSKHRHEMKSLRTGLIPMLLAMGVICGLIILQPNMSMMVIIGALGAVLLFLGGADIKQLLVLGVIAVIAMVVLVQAADYRMDRVISFQDPFLDPKGSGYQLCQSFYALGSGGIFGKGLNNSYQKLLYMVYGESDFIFAILCEEFGLIGGASVILMYAWIVYRGMRVSLLCRNRFGSLMAAGISIVFGMQVIINIGVVTGLLPTTGQALPFISAGGSSLLVFLSAMGILMNISREVDPELLN